MAHSSSRYVVLFDLDGTLTDSQPGIMASYKHVMASYGRNVGEDELLPLLGPPLVDGFRALGVPSSEVRRAIRAYREYYGAVGMFQTEVYLGVREMLDRFDGAAVTMAVATSKSTRFAESVLLHCDMRAAFKVVSGASEDEQRISKAAIISHALEALQCPEPSSTFMVGDREHDILGALANGVRPVGITWGYGSREELLSAGAECLAETPGAVVDRVLAR